MLASMKKYRRKSNWVFLPNVRESGFGSPGNFCLWNPESGKFLLVANLGSWVLESGIQLKEYGSHYRLFSGIQGVITYNYLQL